MKQLMQYPEISFIEDTTLQEVQQDFIQCFCEEYKKITNEEKILSKANPFRMILNACSLQHYQALLYIDNAGKKNLLKYSYDQFLDELGKWIGVKRKVGTKAVTTLKFTLSESRNEVVVIPVGTRVTNGDMLYFSTDTVVQIEKGALDVEVSATCTEIGTKANNFEIGEIRILSDFVPYVKSVENITKTTGGEDKENDESYSERIFLAPSSFSVAGSEDAYKYWVKFIQPSVTDIKIASPSPSVVDIRFLNDSKIPNKSIIEKVYKGLSDKTIRPLGDKVEVNAPAVILYDIDLTYYINESDKNIIANIQKEVDTAIENYVFWQKGKIGRDINSCELLFYLKKAGVKRADIRFPIQQKVDDKSVAILNTKNIIFGGIEDD